MDKLTLTKDASAAKSAGLVNAHNRKAEYNRLMEALEFCVRYKVDTAPALAALDKFRG